MALTVVEKMQQNQPLTASDIQILLQDKNSWLTKLLTESQINIEINNIDFLFFIVRLIEEERRALSQEKLDAIIWAQVVAEKQKEEANADFPVTNPIQPLPPAAQQASLTLDQKFKLTALQNEMTTLLKVPQENMTLTELETHSQRLLTNFNSQVDVIMGPTITLDSGRTIDVPPPEPRPASSYSYNRYLEITGLQALILSGQVEGSDVSKFKTSQEMGTNEVIRRAGKINRNQSMALSVKEFIDCTKKIAKLFSEAKANNPQLYYVLMENKALVIEKVILDHKAKQEEHYAPRPGRR